MGFRPKSKLYELKFEETRTSTASSSSCAA